MTALPLYCCRKPNCLSILIFLLLPLQALAASEFVNVSTRGQVGLGDSVLIGGLIIEGPEPKTVLVRARGPGLVPAIPAHLVLSDPTLVLKGAGVDITNDNWREHARHSEIPPGLQPAEAEPALIATLAPGGYTVIVSGVAGTTGIALFEAFDLSGPTPTRLANVSTRGHVLTGDLRMIGGFSIEGDEPRDVFVRAAGPSLDPNAVPPQDRLGDPFVELIGPDGLIAANNDWLEAPNSGSIPGPLRPLHRAESGILARLDPGNYTAIVSGVAGTTGIGIVEAFTVGEVPRLAAFDISRTHVNLSDGPAIVEVSAEISGFTSPDRFINVWVELPPDHEHGMPHFVALGSARGQDSVSLQVPVSVIDGDTLRVGGITFGEGQINFFSREDLARLGFPTTISVSGTNPAAATTLRGQFHTPEGYRNDRTNPYYHFTVTEAGVVVINHQWVIPDDYRNVWMTLLDANDRVLPADRSMTYRPRVGAFLEPGEYRLDLRACCGFDGEFDLHFAGPVANVRIDTDRDGLVDSVDPDRDNDGIANVDEVDNGLNPLDYADATQDEDRDGASNRAEILAGTDLRNRDSAPLLVTELTFEDANFAACVRRGNARFASDVRNLYCGWSDIASLAGVEQLQGLEMLNLPGNPIIDYSPLASLPWLQSLALSHTGLTDLAFLADLTHLEWLDVGDNGLTNIDVLAGLPGLTELHAWGNELTSVPDLSATQLTVLVLAGNHLDALPALPDTLEELWAGGNRIRSLAPLAGRWRLEALEAQDNLITSLEPIAALTALRRLDVSDNQLTSLADISGLTALVSLRAGGNILTALPALTQTVLEELIIPVNHVATLPPMPDTLRVVRAASNELTGVASLRCLPDLEIVDLQNNHLGDGAVPDLLALTGPACGTGRRLRILNIRANAISTFNGFGEIALFETTDARRPALSNLTFSPGEVNLDTGEALSIALTADPGVRGILELVSQSGEVRLEPVSARRPVNAVFGIHTESGTWRIKGLELFDESGGRGQYNAWALSTLVPTGDMSVELVGTHSDVEPPAITAINYSATTVDASDGTTLLAIEVHATDDVSGINRLNFTVLDGANRTLRNVWEGRSPVSVRIPVDGARGNIRLTNFTVCDVASNCAEPDASELAAAGLIDRVSVSGNSVVTTHSLVTNNTTQFRGRTLGSPAWNFSVTEPGPVWFSLLGDGSTVHLRILDLAGHEIDSLNGSAIGANLTAGDYSLTVDACCNRNLTFDLRVAGAGSIRRDGDGDGIDDDNDTDRDGDGVANETEIALGFDPDDHTDGLADSDDDGASNAVEVALGADHEDPDSLPPRIADLTFADEALRQCVQAAGFGGYFDEATDLDCNGRDIADLTGIDQLLALRTLRLSGANVTSLAPLSGLPDLEVLDVTENNIVDFAPLTALTRLRELHLARNPDAEPQLPTIESLAELHLSGHRLETLGFLTATPNLRRLFLSNNRLRDISAIGALTQIETLDLTENFVSDIGPLANLTQLRELHANNIPAESLSALSGLPLRYLTMGVALIDDITPLATLTELTELRLYGRYHRMNHSPLTDLSPIAALHQLQHLEVNNTGVSDLTPLAGLTRLERIWVQSGDVNDISPLAALTSLQTLGLRDNPVTDGAPIGALVRLRNLHIGETAIEDLTFLTRLPEVHNIDISGLNLSALPPMPPGLQDLDFADNDITDITPLAQYENLQTLHARRNAITDISVLAQFPQLGSVNIEDNGVTDYSVLDDIPLWRRNTDEGRPPLSTLQLTNSVDLTDGARSISFEAVYAPDADDFTVNHFSFTLHSPSSDTTLWFGDQPGGTVQTLRAGAERGRWRGELWMCTDGSGCHLYRSSLLKALGFEPDLDVTATTAAVPLAPPELQTFTATAVEIDVSSGPVGIGFDLVAPGAEWADVRLHTTDYGRSRSIHLSDPLAGPVTFSDIDATGIWQIELSFGVHGGQSVNLDSAELFALGLPYQVVINGPAEPGAPIPVDSLGIADATLANCVSDHGQFVHEIEVLRCNGQDIEQLEGIDGLIATREVQLRDVDIADVSALAGMPHLQRLDLTRTAVTDVSAFEGHPWLTDLNVTGSPVDPGTLPQGLTRLTLERLDLENLDFLSSHSGLIHLGLRHNHIGDISVLAGLTALESLDLDNNRVRDLAPLAGLPLRDLRTNNNPIGDISALAGMPLVELRLGAGLIDDLGPLGDASRLEVLRIDGRYHHVQRSPLTDLSGIAGLPALRELHVSDTRVTSLDVVTTLPNLTVLHVRNSDLTDISVLAQATRITSLGIGSNPITDVSALTAMTELDYLTVAQLGLDSIDFVTHMPRLRELNADGNRLTDIGALAGLPLHRININRNAIAELTPLAGMTTLQYLHADDNAITSVDVLAGINSLGAVDVRRNAISDFTPLDALSLWNRNTDEGYPQVTLGYTDHVDLASGVQVSVDASFLDADADWPVDHINVTFVSPSGLTEIGSHLNDPGRVGLAFHPGAERGLWSARVWVCTTGGPCFNLYAPTLEARGIPGYLDVQGEGEGSTQIPTLTGLTATATTLDLDDGPQAITFTFDAEHFTGGNLVLVTPDYQDRKHLNLDPLDTTVSALFTGVDTRGIWQVEVNLWDDAGHNVNFDAGELQFRGMPFHIDVTASTAPSAAVPVSALSFADPNLETCVHDTGATVHDLRDLHCGNRAISSLGGIGQLPALTRLRLPNNSVADLTPLADLPIIDNLDLGNNDITDFTPLATIATLQELSFAGNPGTTSAALPQVSAVSLRHAELDSLDFLDSWDQITSLDLYDNRITDITALNAMTGLEVLNLGRNRISDLTPLTTLTSLRNIDLHENPIDDLAPLAGINAERLVLPVALIDDLSAIEQMSALERLQLNGAYHQIRRSGLADITVLATLTRLRELDMHNTHVDDLSPLQGLPLTHLSISENDVTDLSPLATITTLGGLHLSQMQPDDFSPLAALVGVAWLTLSDVGIEDISFLAGMRNLHNVNLSRNRIDNIAVLTGAPIHGLDISQNLITDIGAVASMADLNDFRANDNLIGDVGPLANLSRLGRVDVRGNRIGDFAPLDTLSLWSRQTDEGAPAVLALAFPESVDLSSGGVTVDYDIGLGDPAGDTVTGINIAFDGPPDTNQFWVHTNQGDPRPVPNFLPASTRNGQWRPTLTACTAASGCFTWHPDLLEALGFPSTLAVSGSAALPLPVLESLTLGPLAIVQDGSDQQVTLTVTASDLTGGSARLQIPHGGGKWFSLFPVGGEFTVTFNPGDTAGDWYLDLYLQNNDGAQLHLSPDELRELGHPWRVVVEDE